MRKNNNASRNSLQTYLVSADHHVCLLVAIETAAHRRDITQFWMNMLHDDIVVELDRTHNIHCHATTLACDTHLMLRARQSTFVHVSSLYISWNNECEGYVYNRVKARSHSFDLLPPSLLCRR